MSCKPAKFPISDEKMLELLKKYPFLKHRYFWKAEPDDVNKTDAENIESNWYKIWDGSGWEDLWKNRYLPRLFKEYDSWDEDTKSKFFFTDVKEKFGEMRIYTTFSSDKNLEMIAEWLSSCTCQYCGAEPRTPDGKRMSYQSYDWITNMCRNCAIEHELKPAGVTEENYETELKNMEAVVDQFGFKRYGNPTIMTTFKETGDGWLEVDKVEELDKDKEREQFIASLKGE